MTKLFAVPTAPLSANSGAGKILAVSQKPSLLYTRGLVLERTGASVQCATFDLALTLLRVTPYDVVVLCHALSEWEVRRICLEARLAKASARTLLLLSPVSATVPAVEVDLLVQLEDGPKALREGAERLLALAGVSCGTSAPYGHGPKRPGPAFGGAPQASHP